jgi:hypothetical protein
MGLMASDPTQQQRRLKDKHCSLVYSDDKLAPKPLSTTIRCQLSLPSNLIKPAPIVSIPTVGE